MAERLSLRNLLVAAAALLALLFVVGWLTRENPDDKPYLKVLGGGFMFNYREAEVFYGFTAAVVRPLPTGSIIEAAFEDPSGGPEHVVRERVGTGTQRYALRSPPLRGVEADTPYSVDVRVLDRGGDRVIWSDTLAIQSQIDDKVVPDSPLTVGPGYHRNPG